MPDENWLSADDWKWSQDHLPIVCVDMVAVRVDGAGRVERVCLIDRDTPHQGRRWCLVGGRMRRNESVAEAVKRQLLETLGPGIEPDFDPARLPDHVTEYFTTRRPVGFFDPRQHAVALVFVVPVTGDAVAEGEAHGLKWFAAEEMPAAESWGFEQDRVAAACLKRWAGR